MKSFIQPLSYPNRLSRAARQGFTLVELLVVIGIIAILSSAASTAISSIKSASDFNSAVTQVSSVLEEARAYAMAKNTYVFVGFSEVDAAQSPQANPQQAGTGKVVVVAVASKDGTRGFDINSASPDQSWSQNYAAGGNLMLVSRPISISNVDFMDPKLASSSLLASTGAMERPAVTSSNDNISNGASSTASDTPLSFPLGNALSSGTYNFTHVIYFDPQGTARIQYVAGSALDPYLEIDLEPVHGNAVPASTPSDLAAIQVNGVSGAVHIYRR
jgi:prepilin-type N-terminal cleavage/methylation domain-containing protein